MEKDNVQIIKLLNEALEIEYTMIVHLPRLESSLQDDEAKKLVHKLSSDSTTHSSIVANAIKQLGGQPSWSFTPYPDGYELTQIFQAQLLLEQKALESHRQAANLVESGPLADQLNTIADEEYQHIDVVNQIISKLG